MGSSALSSLSMGKSPGLSGVCFIDSLWRASSTSSSSEASTAGCFSSSSSGCTSGSLTDAAAVLTLERSFVSIDARPLCRTNCRTGCCELNEVSLLSSTNNSSATDSASEKRNSFFSLAAASFSLEDSADAGDTAVSNRASASSIISSALRMTPFFGTVTPVRRPWLPLRLLVLVAAGGAGAEAAAALMIVG